MRRGPKPKASTAPKLRENGLPRCPPHLDAVARKEWRRLARPLFEAGILTVADRAAFAAYCQSYSLWAEATRKLQETPKLIKAPSGYVQQSPWFSVANKQLELMGRCMSELDITPTARSRLPDLEDRQSVQPPLKIQLVPLTSDAEEGARDDPEANDVIEIDRRI